MPARVAAVRPSWAIESGRITIEGSGFPIDQPQLPEGAPRRIAPRALSTRRRRASPPSSRRGSKADGRRSASTARAGDAPASTSPRRLPPGCIKSTTRCSIAPAICMSPTAARAASRCRCRSSACAPTARARRSAPGSSIRRRWRSGPTAISMCRAGSRAPSIASWRTAESRRLRPISASRAAWRSIADGTLFVGDRSGTIFRVDRAGQATTHASLPSSVAAFHLAFGPDEALYVTAPTLSPYDSVFRIDRDGRGRHSVHRLRPAAGDRVRPARRSVRRRSARGRQRALPAAAGMSE